MITVVLATYNGQKFIIQQLDSILNQLTKPDEILIFDDCSNDCTQKIINDYIEKNSRNVDIRLTINDKNMGYAENFFKALSKANGDYVFLCDQDDVWYPDKISEIVKIMENNSSILSLNTAYELIDENNKLIKNRRTIKFTNDKTLKKISFKDFIKSPRYPGMTMCIRRSLLSNIHYNNETNIIAHDWLLNQAAAYQGSMYFWNSILTKYRQHSNNTCGISSIKEKKNLVNERLKLIDNLIDLVNMAISIYKKESVYRFLIQYRTLLIYRKKLVKDKSIIKIILFYLKNFGFFSKRCFYGDVYSVLFEKRNIYG